MKKILFVLSVLASLVVFSCNNPSGGNIPVITTPAPGTPTTTEPESPTSAAYNAGDSARANISFGGVTYSKTGEVYVTGPSGASITGTANTNNREGVFIAGRNVTLSPYIMGKYEVTQQLYTAIMTNQTVTLEGTQYTLAASPFACTETGDYPKATTDTQNLRPAECVTWFDAVYFCNKLSEKMGLTSAYNITITTVTPAGNISAATVSLVDNAKGYRLPTEAEWEFAARGGNPSATAWNYIFSGAATATGTESPNSGLDVVGWYYYNLGGTNNATALSSGMAGYGTHEVGTKAENSLHIFDLSGNVYEWCYDLYEANPATGNVTNPVGAGLGSNRIMRGGYWKCNSLWCTVGERRNSCDAPGSAGDYLGFRVVRSAN